VLVLGQILKFSPKPLNAVCPVGGRSMPGLLARYGMAAHKAAALGVFHDQGDAKWIVIRRPLRGHNDTPFRQPTTGWPISRPGFGRPQGVFGVFIYY
jgi:hypothetical protein